MVDPARSQAIAVVGMSGRFPGARDLDAFWRTIREGVENLEAFTDANLDAARVDPVLRAHPRYVRQGTALEDADTFDAAFFGVSPREAQVLDPQQRVFLECAWEALEHAGHGGIAGRGGPAVGVYAGVGMNTYLLGQLLTNPSFVASTGGYQLMIGNDKDFLSTRVSYKLDLRGPSVTVQTACSTSLVAVVLACRALQRGECDVALAGGVSIPFPQRAGYLFEEGMILSPDGHCRPFDEQARGTRSSAGAGVVVLKPLASALADGDTIHAVILGAAINNDGAAKAGYTAPSVDGQVEVIATAQALAGVDARSIAYLETHGTGTPLGDPIEVAALTQVFRASTPDVGFCRLGSLKANLGHLDAAAGVASLIKAILVLKHRELPPLVNFRTANPQLGLDTSPFVASRNGSPWEAVGDQPRRAGVSSFGIGGTNAHVVLEEAPPRAQPDAPARDAQLLVLSAKTPTALDQATTALRDHLAAHPELPLADVAWTLGVGRRAMPHRRAVVARSAAHAVEILGQAGRPPVLTGTSDGGERPVAFLFSGQGSQHTGMGGALYREERVYREAVDACAVLLEPHLGLDLRAVLFAPEPDAAIDETRLTQPALFVTSYALACLWKSWGVVPAAMLGHSVGEYVAAHLAGVFSLEDALALVAARGRLMQEQPAGGMAAVHLEPAELGRWLADGVELAAVNAPGMCTVSGPTASIERLLERLGAAGIESRALRTSHAFHSAMMEPALAPFLAVFDRIALSPPKLPYVSNLTGAFITEAQATSPDYYARHLRHAVRFEAGVRALAADPALLFLEVGPGNALTSLTRLTLGKDAARRAFGSLPHPRERRSDAETALEAAGRLWLAGVAVDWTGLHAGRAPRRVPLPTYPFERVRYWVDAAPVAQRDTGSAARTSSAVEDWFYAPTWARDDSLVAHGPRLEHAWLLLVESGALGEAVARLVKAAGAAPVVVETGERFERLEASRYRVRPASAEDFAAVVRDVQGATGRIAGAIHLWSVAPDPAGAAPGAAVARGYHALVSLAAALDGSSGAEPVRVIVATSGAESVLDEPVRSPEAAMVVGPVLVLPTEVRGLRMRAVDLADLHGDRRSPGTLETAARELVEEAAAVDGERLVARRAGRRWVRRFERLALPPAPRDALPLKPRGVYLITGGLGGIGLTLARWLATHASARLLLTTRTPLSGQAADDRNAQVTRALREIEAAGGEVHVAVAAAEDEDAMRRAIDEATGRWGALDGVIHAAGVAGTGALALRKQPGELDAVLAPKVDGLAVLVRLLGDRALDFVALFSSINSVLGAPGVCDYASANAVLDAFVDTSTRPAGWRRVIAFDWGPWREVGMAAKLVVPESLRKEREALLASAISPAAGADAFGRVLASGRRRVVIVPFDLTRAIAAERDHGDEPAAHGAGAAGAPTKVAAPAQARPELSSAYEAPTTETGRLLVAIWSELLGIEQVGVHDDFFALGGHSLLATRVLARIEQALGARLTLRDIFEAPTVHRLSEKVDAGARAQEDDREEIEF